MNAKVARLSEPLISEPLISEPLISEPLISELAYHVLRDMPKNDAGVFAPAIARTSWPDTLGGIFFQPQGFRSGPQTQ